MKYLVLILLFLFPLTAGAITHTTLTSGGSSVLATSYTTASITPVANKLTVIAIANGSNVDNINQPTTVSGGGITFTKLLSVNFQGAAGTNRRWLTLWYGTTASPTTGVITISFGATNQRVCSWDVEQFSYASIQGVNGLNGFVEQYSNSSGSASSISTTLLGYATSNDAAFAAFANGSQESTSTPQTGWNQLMNDQEINTGMQTLTTQFIRGNSNTASVTWGSAGTSAYTVVELGTNTNNLISTAP